ncbi:BCCT family transporter [Veillonella magna]|uniref:BCCT family transporter n=1 Tax=Veillonella magna TaxID=464322 RepID=A0ABS2GHV1_9FIRM|nr:BCCT family transporter [Veillonella magna]MBM6825108.1 BCCT family transporter [Veillonella magna]MBM6913402.1 BCCT family transporter [Veillonella magna]
MNTNEKKGLLSQIRWEVFIPSFLLVAGAAVMGLLNNDKLAAWSKLFFSWSLDHFGWLYQLVVTFTCLLVLYLMLSKAGSIRFGGKNAKPKYSFWLWFAMSLTGGVATGIVTWGVNEPLIYLGNIYGELDGYGIAPFTTEAAVFSMARNFHNWTILPYSVYALAGVLVAYVYFNKREPLAVTATLRPLLGKKVESGLWAGVIDTLSMLAVALGLTSGLTMCIILLTSGLNFAYDIDLTLGFFIGTGIFSIVCFTMSTYLGIDRGIKKLADLNAYFYYGLLVLLVVTGPVLFILDYSTTGLGYWLQNFWSWSLDTGVSGGKPLVQSWTLFDWAIWIAYAPVTGIFLGMIAYGRTVREFLIVNFILPAVFGLLWFSIWGGTAMHMQLSGAVDLVGTIKNSNAVNALWQFLQNMPFGLGWIILPVNLFVILISFVTAADAASNNVASMCIKDVPIGSEAPGSLKVLWGATIGVVAILMAAFSGSEQGVEGVKALATVGGFFVLFVFMLQLMSAIKMFFVDELVEPKEAVLPELNKED